MYYKFREPNHRWSIDSVIDLDNNRVLRGPFHKNQSLIEREKYQRINSLLEEENFIPEVFKEENDEYLVLPLLIKGKIIKKGNIISCQSLNFNWDKSEYEEKIHAFKNLICRFIINSGSGSLDNFLIYKNFILQLGLDIPKFRKSLTFIEMILSQNIDRNLKEKISTFVYNNIHVLLEFLDSIKDKLTSQELVNYQSLYQSLLSRNIIKSEYDTNYEAEKGKRGPKPKPKQFKETSSYESRSKSIPLKLNYQNCVVPTEVKPPVSTLNLGDFINIFYYYQERNNLLEFKQEIYKFMLEYLSVESWTEYSQFIVSELENSQLENIINVYNCLSQQNKSQELFKAGMLNTHKMKAKISLSELYSLEPPPHLIEIYKILPFYTRYIYILMKFCYEKDLSFTFLKINKVKFKSSVKKLDVTWVDACKIIYNCLLSGDLSTEANYKNSSQLFSNTHIGLLNIKSLEQECLRLKAFKLPIQPGTLLAIRS